MGRRLTKYPKYPVHELFHTFQGEGVHAGKQAFFIRLYGCPVKCPWCDSAGTWHPSWVPKDVARMEAQDLLHAAQDAGAGRVVITGGEPAVFDLEPLTCKMMANGIQVHVETSGAFEMPWAAATNWITVSPKKWKLPHPSVYGVANEFKLIIETPADIPFYLELLRNNRITPELWTSPPIWLHPEWSQRNNSDVLKAIVNVVKMNPMGTLRAGWQVHKLYQADSLDNRSRPLVPLGGDPSKGY